MTILIPREDLLELTTQVFLAAGVAPAMAGSWAEVLVWANLRGTDSHGVMRVPRYLSLLQQGAINGTPDLRVARDAAALVVIEADNAPGGPAMLRAMDEAIARAKVHNIAWCAARNITHAGAVGYYALQAAKAGMAGIVMTASGQPLMAYHGARVSGVSTNPIAIALPARRSDPLLLDMSTSAIAYGKLLAAREQQAEIPAGGGIGRDGKETTNSSEVETLLPLGGAKGSGLSFMIECLSSLAVGNPLISLSLAGKISDGGPSFNGVAVAVNLAALGDPEQFDSALEDLSNELAALPRADGVEKILMPGERGRATMRIREQEGIPLPPGTWDRLVQSARDLGVSTTRYEANVLAW